MGMIDREKVTKDLHDIAGFIAGRFGIEQARNFLRTIDDAVAMLKEQEGKIKTLEDKNAKLMLLVNEYLKKEREEAVEPFHDDNGAYWCGSCHEDLVWHQKYCPNCGRPILWEGR